MSKTNYNYARRVQRWSEVLPLDMAERQAAAELRNAVMRARAAGAMLKDIGKMLGVSIERVRQIEMKGEWFKKNSIRSPIERFLDTRPAGGSTNE